MRSAGFLFIAAMLTTVGCSKPTVVSRAESSVTTLGAPSAPGTSREELARTVERMEARLAAAPADAAAAVRLADAYLRQTRVLGNAGLAVRAERVLLRVLAADPDRYDARRMLTAVLLSQHRFRDAIREAERVLQAKPNDAWLLGVIGDGRLELGEYNQAFEAFNSMTALRPDAASYARVSYARELEGDLDGAARLMAMALEAASPNDPEAKAWYHAQLGGLDLARGKLADAQREYAHAAHIFPEHPSALEGLARIAAARGNSSEALRILDPLLQHSPTPSVLAYSADLLRTLGRNTEADRQDLLAEAAWRSDVPEPARLAVFLANRGAHIDEAVAIAEAAVRDRDDIFTDDALAWAYFRAGRLEDAARLSARATRTGTRDRSIRAHAASITRAVANQ